MTRTNRAPSDWTLGGACCFLLLATHLTAQEGIHTIIDGGTAEGTVIDADGGFVLGPPGTFGVITGGEDGCPAENILIDDLTFNTDLHFHGTLNNAPDPAETGCGHGRVVSGDFSALFPGGPGGVGAVPVNNAGNRDAQQQIHNTFRGLQPGFNDLDDSGQSGVATVTTRTAAQIPRPVPNNVLASPVVPPYINDRANESFRDGLRDKYRGTGNIADVAEALARRSDINYDQTTNQELYRMASKAAPRVGEKVSDVQARLSRTFINMASPDDLLYTTRGSCYEFVHFAAYLAGNGEGTLHNPMGGVKAFLDTNNLKEWDFESDIPRGMIIIGCGTEEAGGQDQYGFLHVAVSLGHRQVASNRGRGAQIESLDTVFDWYDDWFRGGTQVYYGEYKGYKLPTVPGEYFGRRIQRFNIDIDALEDGDPGGKLSDEQAAQELAEAGLKIEVLHHVLDRGPQPDYETLFQQDYAEFVHHMATGIARHHRFFLTDFNLWRKLHGREPRPEPQATVALSSYTEEVDEQRRFEREASDLFLQLFHQHDGDNARTPPVKKQ